MLPAPTAAGARGCDAGTTTHGDTLQRETQQQCGREEVHLSPDEPNPLNHILQLCGYIKYSKKSRSATFAVLGKDLEKRKKIKITYQGCQVESGLVKGLFISKMTFLSYRLLAPWRLEFMDVFWFLVYSSANNCVSIWNKEGSLSLHREPPLVVKLLAHQCHNRKIIL